MKHLKNSLVVFASVLAITGVLTLFIPSPTKGMPDSATKGTFSISTKDHLLLVQDPEGTSYAITSFTVANDGSFTEHARIDAVWKNTADCSYSGSSTTIGPTVQVPVGETVHLEFPQPFILSAQPGSVSCLRLDSADGSTYTVVGYRF